jgi:hypothetical protein
MTAQEEYTGEALNLVQSDESESPGVLRKAITVSHQAKISAKRENTCLTSFLFPLEVLYKPINLSVVDMSGSRLIILLVVADVRPINNNIEFAFLALAHQKVLKIIPVLYSLFCVCDLSFRAFATSLHSRRIAIHLPRRHWTIGYKAESVKV